MNASATPDREPPADPAGTGRGARRGGLREALVQAGIAGLEAPEAAELSLRGLARAVGVSPAAAYRHFADKDALLAAIAEHGFADLAAGFPPPGGAARARLLAIGEAYLDFAAARPAMFALMFSAAVPPGAAAPGAAAAHDALTAAVADVVGADHPALAACTLRLWALVHGLAVLAGAGRISRSPLDAAMRRAVLAPVVAAL